MDQRSEEADLPTVVRKLDLSSSRTPTAFRGARVRRIGQG